MSTETSPKYPELNTTTTGENGTKRSHLSPLYLSSDIIFHTLCNGSVPYEGVHINFVRALEKISEGDFAVNFVHGSKSSRDLYPDAPGTAAVQDVADGLADIAVGPFWITAPRLEMTAFTLPIRESIGTSFLYFSHLPQRLTMVNFISSPPEYDRTLLVIRKPGAKRSLTQETQKVLDPFDLVSQSSFHLEKG